VTDKTTQPARKNEIWFAGNARWCAVNQAESRRIGLDTYSMSFPMRIYHVALGSCNKLGHAEFGPSELRGLLATPVKRSGEIRLPAPATVSTAIRTCKDWGLLDQSSCAQCLVLPRNLVFRGGPGTNSCTYHRLNKNHGLGLLDLPKKRPERRSTQPFGLSANILGPIGQTASP